MKKVAILKSRLSYLGGLEKMTKLLALRFVERECHVTILTTTPCSQKLPGVNILEIGRSSSPSSFDRACQRWVENNSYDIVFGMERTTKQTHYRAGSGVHAVYLQRRALTDSFFKRLSFPLNPHHRALLTLEKKCFNDPALKILFTNSEMVKQEILTHYQTPREKIEVVYNGAPFSLWESHFEASLKRKKNDLFEFLFIGNGFRRKGLEFLLKGLSLIKPKKFHLSILGSDKNPSSFKKMSHALGLAPHVTFFGPQSDILPFYERADALVIPSIYDPCANVTLEALAMGLFVLSSPFNGAAELLSPLNGIVINNLKDPQNLRECLENALLHPKNPSDAERIRNTIKELDFSIQLDKIVEKTLK